MEISVFCAVYVEVNIRRSFEYRKCNTDYLKGLHNRSIYLQNNAEKKIHLTKNTKQEIVKIVKSIMEGQHLLVKSSTKGKSYKDNLGFVTKVDFIVF